MRRGGGTQGRRRVAALMAISVVTAAAPAAAETLSAAVAKGLARHPEIRAAEAEAEMAATEVGIARNGYLPTLGASAGPAGGDLGYDVTLSQTLYDFGAVGGQMQQKRALLAQAQAELEVVRDDVALEIVEVYLDIASRRAQLSLVEAHVERLAELTGMARTRVEARYSDEAETGRVALALATAEGTRARLQGELAEATDHYALLVGDPAEGVRLPSPPGFLETVSERRALEAAIAAAPVYRRAALAVRAAEGAAREARALRFPRLALEASLQRREIGGRMVEDSVIGLRFRLGGQQGLSALQRPRLEAQRRAAAAMAARAAAMELTRTVESLEAQDGALGGRIVALSDQAEHSRGVRDVYREQFLVGRRDIQDLVVMETEHFEAERQIVELTIERLRLQYRAAAQLGRLSATLSGAGQTLEPETAS